jgi:hypothetical protein
MLMMKEPRAAFRTIEGWARSILLDAGAICECEEHGWAKDRADPHARERSTRAAPCRSAVALPVGATSNACSGESRPDSTAPAPQVGKL